MFYINLVKLKIVWLRTKLKRQVFWDGVSICVDAHQPYIAVATVIISICGANRFMHAAVPYISMFLLATTYIEKKVCPTNWICWLVILITPVDVLLWSASTLHSSGNPYCENCSWYPNCKIICNTKVWYLGEAYIFVVKIHIYGACIKRILLSNGHWK